MWQGLEIKPSLEHPLRESRLLDGEKIKLYYFTILAQWRVNHNGLLENYSYLDYFDI